MKLISRLAPTPNGDIHWGNLINFVLTWGHIRRHGGKLWLRFDDIDQGRCHLQYADSTRKILEYLGLTWDEEFSKQFERVAQYRQFLTKIPHYVCACSRQEIKKRTGDYHYDGHCRELQLSYKPGTNAIRFRHPHQVDGDLILWRREDLPAYHLTSIYDDWVMQVNTIVRGADLEESTHIQKEISATLVEDPLNKVEYFHHRLITDANGQKLSKSRHDGDLIKLLKDGMKAQEFWRRIAQLLQLPEISSAQEFLAAKWQINEF